MELLDVIRAVRRRWTIVLGALVLTTSVAWLAFPPPPEPKIGSPPKVVGYTATHILMSDRDGSLTEAKVALPLLAKLTTTGEVPRRVTERLGLDVHPDSLAGRVKIEPDTELGLLSISSEGSDQQAAELVDAYAEEVLRFAAQRNHALRREAIARTEVIIEQLRGRIAYLDARFVRETPRTTPARLLDAERNATLTVYGEFLERLQTYVAQPPSSPGLVSLGKAVPIPTISSSPLLLRPSTNRRSRIGLAALLGLAAGIGLAALLERVDSRVRSRQAAERALHLPIIAEIPAIRSKPGEGTVREAWDAYGRLAVAMLHTPRWLLQMQPHAVGAGEQQEEPTVLVPASGTAPRTVLVSSPNRGDGRTTTATHLAAALSASGYSVAVLIPPAERTEALNQLGGGQPSGNGQAAWLLPGGAPVLPTATPGVWVSAAVQSSARRAGPSDQAAVLQDCLARVDLVLIDAGPLLSGRDASAWAVAADAVLVAARAGHTTLGAASQACELLARLQAHVLGVAFIDEPISPLARLVRLARGERPGPHAPPDPGGPAGTPPTDGQVPETQRVRQMAADAEVRARSWFSPARDEGGASAPVSDARAWTASAARSAGHGPAGQPEAPDPEAKVRTVDQRRPGRWRPLR